ncbi:hypothetical protein [Saccharopolyspora sp. ASAGF58]|uniref:hypothetical protein n=1 Tax=Saccharopolyspora sp. ASAGF58 TaxID=2719023 RepID=UPI001FF09905|nr:hypothetical protein [Saccharopolyspora sp. ASAGF58]
MVGTVIAEITIAAVAGTVVGLVLSWPLRYLGAQIPWGGGTWLPSDFTPSLPTLVAVAVVIPLLVVLAAVLGLRRVVQAPVGAAMSQSRKAPKAWRLLAGRRLCSDPKAAYRSVSGIVLAVFVGSMALTLLPSFETFAGGGARCRPNARERFSVLWHPKSLTARWRPSRRQLTSRSASSTSWTAAARRPPSCERNRSHSTPTRAARTPAWSSAARMPRR